MRNPDPPIAGDGSPQLERHVPERCRRPARPQTVDLAALRGSTRMKPRPATAMLAAIAAVAVIGWAPQATADGGAKTRIEIKKLRASTSKGTVRSGRNACESGRKVSLFVLDDFVSDKVAITKTNSRGKWRVKKNLKPGTYFAKVDAVPGCRYDVSPSRRLG